MKLSLFSEDDKRMRELLRRIHGYGDEEDVAALLRIKARERSDTWKEPGINQQFNKLKSYESKWRFLEYPFDISFNSDDMSDQEAIGMGIDLLRRNGIVAKGWNVVDEDVDVGDYYNRYLVVDIEVSKNFVDRLNQVGSDITWETNDEIGLGGRDLQPRVVIHAQYYGD